MLIVETTSMLLGEVSPGGVGVGVADQRPRVELANEPRSLSWLRQAVGALRGR